jgi:16S rRNA (cytosine1402-N4)-methyltransferase
VDTTFGGGGHSRAIISQLSEGKLIAFDQDKDSLQNTIEDDRFTLIQENFRFLKNFLRLHGIKKIDGLLADLGVSSYQFDTPNRGFSIRFDGPIDGRMNQQSNKTGADILNTYSLKELHQIFKQYGELKQAYKISQAVVDEREISPFKSIEQLKTKLKFLAPTKRENQFFAQVFQALRIEINEELEALKELLKQLVDIMNPGGRLVVISYHSLEDRIVKSFVKTGNTEGIIKKDFYGKVLTDWKVITRKPIFASNEEKEKNSRSRSARLRIAERI